MKNIYFENVYKELDLMFMENSEFGLCLSYFAPDSGCSDAHCWYQVYHTFDMYKYYYNSIVLQKYCTTIYMHHFTTATK